MFNPQGPPHWVYEGMFPDKLRRGGGFAAPHSYSLVVLVSGF